MILVKQIGVVLVGSFLLLVGRLSDGGEAAGGDGRGDQPVL